MIKINNQCIHFLLDFYRVYPYWNYSIDIHLLWLNVQNNLFLSFRLNYYGLSARGSTEATATVDHRWPRQCRAIIRMYISHWWFIHRMIISELLASISSTSISKSCWSHWLQWRDRWSNRFYWLCWNEIQCHTVDYRSWKRFIRKNENSSRTWSQSE